MLQEQVQLVAAEHMDLRALAGREKAQGPVHTSTLATVNNLGLLYRDQGKLKGPETMNLRALDGYKKALGRQHSSFLNTANDLAGLYREQGKPDEAEQVLRLTDEQ